MGAAGRGTEGAEAVSTDVADAELAETDIAIVGMAGRFPGAPDADALWRRVARRRGLPRRPVA